jgi:hypothetical protein
MMQFVLLLNKDFITTFDVAIWKNRISWPRYPSW